MMEKSMRWGRGRRVYRENAKVAKERGGGRRREMLDFKF
jgi:hypothetical protein